MFGDRSDAGRQLARALGTLPEDALILGIPRGGVVVARAVADALERPLDVLVVRKLGAPRNSELAIGAIGPDGHVSLDDDVLRAIGEIPPGYIERESVQQLNEIERRLRLYRGEAAFPELDGRCCVVVDDGIATGSTARAALGWLQSRGAKPVVLAVPVAPERTVTQMEAEADRVVCLHAPPTFIAVGQWYGRFDQVPDADVIAALTPVRSGSDAAS
jgi:putative phosphoribosyl transferase